MNFKSGEYGNIHVIKKESSIYIANPQKLKINKLVYATNSCTLYEDENDNLLMTVKINGDSDKELAEIYDSYISWAEAQSRFSPGENSTNTSGKLYIGDTNFWIENNNGFVRLILSQDLDILVNILTNCSSGSCKKDF